MIGCGSFGSRPWPEEMRRIPDFIPFTPTLNKRRCVGRLRRQRVGRERLLRLCRGHSGRRGRKPNLVGGTVGTTSSPWTRR